MRRTSAVSGLLMIFVGFATIANARDLAATEIQASATAGAQTSAETNQTIRRYIIVHGDMTSGSWDNDSNVNDLRSRYGDDFAWFRQNGKDYVVTDAETMAELDKAMEPQKGVNRMQADVNREQSRVNDLQNKVNAHQNEINGLQNEVNRRQNLANQIQAAVNGGNNSALAEKLEAELRELRAQRPEASQALVNHKQSEVNQEQSGVNAEQHKVNAMQQKVNEEQHRVSAEFNRRIQDILGSAAKKGTAKEVK